MVMVRTNLEFSRIDEGSFIMVLPNGIWWRCEIWMQILDLGSEDSILVKYGNKRLAEWRRRIWFAIAAVQKGRYCRGIFMGSMAQKSGGKKG
ncbi:hypothetical protein Bca4012_025981 [Brassica carinata]